MKVVLGKLSPISKGRKGLDLLITLKTTLIHSICFFWSHLLVGLLFLKIHITIWQNDRKLLQSSPARTFPHSTHYCIITRTNKELISCIAAQGIVNNIDYNNAPISTTKLERFFSDLTPPELHFLSHGTVTIIFPCTLSFP